MSDLTDKLYIALKGLGEPEENRSIVEISSIDDVEQALSTCQNEARLMWEVIEQREIPFPQQIGRHRPTLNLKSSLTTATPPPDRGTSPSLLALGTCDLAKVLGHITTVANGRRVIVVGDANAHALVSSSPPTTSDDFLYVQDGYGAERPSDQDFLRRPPPGTFFSLLLETDQIRNIGAILFLGDAHLSSSLGAVLDSGICVPTYSWSSNCQFAQLQFTTTSSLPRISIVIPSFNQSGFLEEAIKSILSQAYYNLEIIIVDGGSTDGSIDIIERYRKYFAAVIIEPDQGQSDALNKGFELATGEVLNWLCCDDLLEPGALMRVGETYARTKADIIAGGCIRINQERSDELFRHHSMIGLGENYELNALSILKFMSIWQSGAYFFQPEVFFSKRIWRLSGGFLKRHLYYVMDYDLWLRMALAGASVRHIPQYLACSRVHEDQKTRDSQQYLYQTQQLMDEYADIFRHILQGLSASNKGPDHSSQNGETKTMSPFNNQCSDNPQYDLDIKLLTKKFAELSDHCRSLEESIGNFEARLDSMKMDAGVEQIESKLNDLLGHSQMLGYHQNNFGERTLLLQGRMASNALPESLYNLAQAEFKVSSQWGEDGIIEWLIRTINPIKTSFVEFGVENFSEANCRFLLQNRNWRGLVMDGNKQYMDSLKNGAMYWMYDLTAVSAFITAENIDKLIENAGFAGELGLLSIDLDGNDYWIWNAIESVRPDIVICEYNPIFGDVVPVALPYLPAFNRFDGHHSGLYFGCSLPALVYLAERKGYKLIGTNSNGINAFFVRDDIADRVLCKLSSVDTYPSRHRDSRDEKGHMCYLGGLDRLAQLGELPVLNVVTGRSMLIKDIEAPYSDSWLTRML